MTRHYKAKRVESSEFSHRMSRGGNYGKQLPEKQLPERVLETFCYGGSNVSYCSLHRTHDEACPCQCSYAIAQKNEAKLTELKQRPKKHQDIHEVAMKSGEEAVRLQGALLDIVEPPPVQQPFKLIPFRQYDGLSQSEKFMARYPNYQQQIKRA
jgi:hypothetical protein